MYKIEKIILDGYKRLKLGQIGHIEIISMLVIKSLLVRTGVESRPSSMSYLLCQRTKRNLRKLVRKRFISVKTERVS